MTTKRLSRSAGQPVSRSAGNVQLGLFSEKKTTKEIGQVFTPRYLVEDILDIAGYTSESCILQKHIIDNSCGAGAFLEVAAKRYIDAFLKVSTDLDRLSDELSTYVHGIDSDKSAYESCIARLNSLAASSGIPSVRWDVRLADTLSTAEFSGKIDFVIGNPPYVRVHNLHENLSAVKKYKFCQGGMTDLYLLFYEISFKMLSPHGRLCFITASSWINSLAGAEMREYVHKHRNLRAFYDLGHFQAFDATTYTAISLFENGTAIDDISCYQYAGPHDIRKIADIPYDDAFFHGCLFIGTNESINDLRQIMTGKFPRLVTVKNGFATLADSVFIQDSFPFEHMVIPVIKGSTGKWRKAFYPYDKDGKPLCREKIFSDDKVACYLNSKKGHLLKGRSEADVPEWYLYGRTQALKDVWSNKYSINSVVRDVQSIKLHKVEAGAGIYSGLYILTDVSMEKLKEALCSQEFIRYITMLRKYKSGGYYTFSSKELERYLNYKLSSDMGGQNE